MQRPACTNLTRQQWNLKNELKHSKRYITFAADKNLGVALLERKEYERRVWADHLSDESTHRIIPQEQVHATKVRIKYELGEFLSEI